MGRYLLIANQTLGGQELDDEIARRIDAGDAHFHVVVPMIEPESEAAFRPGDPAFRLPDVAAPADAGPGPLEVARERSQHRLDRVLARIRTLGGEADGEVGPQDVLKAAEDAMARYEPDEVILSTLPSGISRWLNLDVPSRLESHSDVPVTVVEAVPA